MTVLAGVRVLDFSRVLAGPTVTRLMAELGAEVIKLETPPGGDMSRLLPYLRDGRSGYFIQQNRGKRSLCADLRTPEGLRVAEDLVRAVDVIVENFRPGVLAAMGLGWDRIRELNPRAILCSVTALGQDGPLATKPGYDTVGAAYSGIAHMSGPVGGPPMMPTAAIGDTMTGVHGFGGVAAALFNRERTGLGDWVQVSLLDSYMHCHEINIQAYTGSDGAIVPGPTGRYHPSVCPAGLWRCHDRYVFMACIGPDEWGKLARAMGRPELGDDPDFATNEARVKRLPEIIDLIEGWFDTQPDLDTAVALLEAAGVPVAPILTVAEAVEHEHNLARRAVRTVPDDRWGEITIPGMPIRFGSVGEEPDLRARELGADNGAVLRDVLGYDDARIQDLVERGVLRSTAHDPMAEPRP